MSEMIERVARAILEADVASTQEDFPDTPPNILRVAAEALFERHHIPMAGAAIEEVRECFANIAQTHIPEGIHPDDLYRWRDTAGAIAAAIRTTTRKMRR